MRYMMIMLVLAITGCATVEESEKVESFLGKGYKDRKDQVMYCVGRSRATMDCGYVDRYVMEQNLRRMGF